MNIENNLENLIPEINQFLHRSKLSNFWQQTQEAFLHSWDPEFPVPAYARRENRLYPEMPFCDRLYKFAEEVELPPNMELVNNKNVGPIHNNEKVSHLFFMVNDSIVVCLTPGQFADTLAEGDEDVVFSKPGDRLEFLRQRADSSGMDIRIVEAESGNPDTAYLIGNVRDIELGLGIDYHSETLDDIWIIPRSNLYDGTVW